MPPVESLTSAASAAQPSPPEWLLYAAPAMTLLGVGVALLIAVLNQRHDSQERREDREVQRQVRLDDREEQQRLHALAQARTVVGGLPERAARFAGRGPHEPDARDVPQVGPTVVNGSDSLISEVRLIGAVADVGVYDVVGERWCWYPARKAGDGIASLIRPKQELEFAAQWVREALPPFDEPGYMTAPLPLDSMPSMRVAFEWIDGSGQRWLRTGCDDPRLVDDIPADEYAKEIAKWRPRVSPEG